MYLSYQENNAIHNHQFFLISQVAYNVDEYIYRSKGKCSDE